MLLCHTHDEADLDCGTARIGTGPMIVGTGVDLCEVDRIEKAMASSYGRRFRERVYTDLEIAYAERKANPFERYAARFAAKEAGMKALGTGWSHGVRWRDIEVVRPKGQRPTIQFHGAAAAIAAELGTKNIALSLTLMRHSYSFWLGVDFWIKPRRPDEP